VIIAISNVKLFFWIYFQKKYELFITNTRDRASLPRVENILVDGGYTGQAFADKIRKILGCPVEVVKRSDEHGFKVIPKALGGGAVFCLVGEISAIEREKFRRVSKWSS